MQDVNAHSVPSLRNSALQILEFNVPFCLGETRHYFKRCDLFHSFHAVVEVQFGSLARLDRTANNYKDNLNSLYRHPDLTLTIDKAFRNIIVSAYSHHIDSWPMNGACMVHRAILMRSMLQFAMHYGRYRRCQRYFVRDWRRKGLPSWAPMPSIDVTTLLNEEEENLKLRQIDMTHVSIMELLGDPGNPLYAEPHSMAEHFDAMLVGARALSNLPKHSHCKNSSAMARVLEDEAQQVCQKILRCLDMRVMDDDLVVPTCLEHQRLSSRPGALYSCTMTWMLRVSTPPTSLLGAEDSYSPGGTLEWLLSPGTSESFPMTFGKSSIFHREGLEAKGNRDSDDCMSTDTEAANTARRLQLHCPAATAMLQMAVREALAAATAARPEEEEYLYDSDDSVLDLDEEYPGLAEQVVQLHAARQSTTCAPPCRPSNFGQPKQSHFNKLPDLRELLNQAKEAKASRRAPIQPVAPMQLPFASVRDLDRQRQQRHDQTMAKHQSSPLGWGTTKESQDATAARSL